eukprot:5902586-Pleurochrysis_carterae.AAC.2
MQHAACKARLLEIGVALVGLDGVDHLLPLGLARDERLGVQLLEERAVRLLGGGTRAAQPLLLVLAKGLLTLRSRECLAPLVLRGKQRGLRRTRRDSVRFCAVRRNSA